MVKFGILGPIELTDGERQLAVGGPRQVALLAFLLLHPNRAVSADQLLDAVWGADAGRAVKRLHTSVARLRKTLDTDGSNGGPTLKTVIGGYMLTVEPGQLDADVFQAGVEDGRRALDEGEAARAAGVLRDALGLWRGPALAEVAYEAFAQGEIRRLEELRLAALEARIEADLQLGRHARVIGELEALVASHPAREQLVGQLMVALYRSVRSTGGLQPGSAGAHQRDWGRAGSAAPPSPRGGASPGRIARGSARYATAPARARSGVRAFARGPWERARAAFGGLGSGQVR
jgi:DNA-binding SARP family transcriptional activator